MKIKNKNRPTEVISGMVFPGLVPRLAPSSLPHSGTIPISVRRFSVGSSTRPDGERGHSGGGRARAEGGGGGRVVVNVSSCRFPQSQLVFSLTSPFNYSRALISSRLPGSARRLASPGQNKGGEAAVGAGAECSSNIATWEIIKSSCSR